jgi:hypothetical protein
MLQDTGGSVSYLTEKNGWTKAEKAQATKLNITSTGCCVDEPTTSTELDVQLAPTKLFTGLEVGQSAVCFPIKQGLSTRAANGFTTHQAIEEIGMLDVRIMTRIE